MEPIEDLGAAHATAGKVLRPTTAARAPLARPAAVRPDQHGFHAPSTSSEHLGERGRSRRSELASDTREASQRFTGSTQTIKRGDE